MKDIALDESGDLLITNEGDIAFTDSVKQAIIIRLKWFAQEWKLGPDLGIPYYDDFFMKNPSKLLMQEEIREAIMSVDEVEQVPTINLEINTQSRTLEISFMAICKDGTSAEGRLVLDA
jgi:hypothetical protein